MQLTQLLYTTSASVTFYNIMCRAMGTTLFIQFPFTASLHANYNSIISMDKEMLWKCEHPTTSSLYILPEPKQQ